MTQIARPFIRFAAAAALLAVGACQTSGSYVWANSLSPSESTGAYTIGIGDVISVNVFNNANMSAPKVRVRSDGKVSIPLLNDVDAAGRTPTELATDLEKRMKAADLVVSPHVTIQIDEAAKIGVSILGKVARPGNYELAPNAGMAEALAIAGGLTDFAHKDRIFVLRRAPQPVRIRFTFDAITSGTQNDALFRLRSGDVVVAE